MKRLMTVFIMFVLVFTLTGCVSMHYQETEYRINDYKVYIYDHRTSEIECDRISPFGVFVRDDNEEYITNKDFGECMNTLFVKKNGTYYNLIKAVEEGLFTVEDVMEVDWDFDVYATHALLDYTDVDYFMFKTEDSVTYDDTDNIERVLTISESTYQLFLIGYMPEQVESLGTIEVYLDDERIVTLDVYSEGIYDPSTDAFQPHYSSELHGLYLALMIN